MNDVKQTLAAMMISKGTELLLRENGRSDQKAGVKMHDGWKEIAEACGYPVYERTPAREAYEDGYYGV